MHNEKQRIQEQCPRRKPNRSCSCRVSLMLPQHVMDKWSSRRRGRSCSLPSQDVPTSPPCFSSLSLLTLFQGQNTSIKELCSLPRVQVVLSSPPPEKFPGAVIYTRELRPHHLNSAEICKLLPAPQGRSPSSSQRWGHSGDTLKSLGAYGICRAFQN